jgi:hypothetical protein
VLVDDEEVVAAGAIGGRGRALAGDDEAHVELAERLHRRKVGLDNRPGQLALGDFGRCGDAGPVARDDIAAVASYRAGRQWMIWP